MRYSNGGRADWPPHIPTVLYSRSVRVWVRERRASLISAFERTEIHPASPRNGLYDCTSTYVTSTADSECKMPKKHLHARVSVFFGHGGRLVHRWKANENWGTRFMVGRPVVRAKTFYSYLKTIPTIEIPRSRFSTLICQGILIISLE